MPELQLDSSISITRSLHSLFNPLAMLPVVSRTCLLFVISLWMSFHVPSCIAIDDVTSIDITTASHEKSKSENTIHITLWFNFTIYQYSLLPTNISHTYSTIAFNHNFGPSDCHKPYYNDIPNAKIMIENDSDDGIMIDMIAFHTVSGAWYGISGRCYDNELAKEQNWLLDNEWSDLVMDIDESSCSSGITNIVMTVDNEKDDSRPYKQIFYFDTQSPNQYINNASWSDGSDVTPQIVSCSPTSNPTDYPSNIPSNSPIIPPTSSPTSNPSMTPTNQPTLNPTQSTMHPTWHPSYNPTIFPSLYPSWEPSVSPIKTPTGNPFQAPTNVPTVAINAIETTQSQLDGLSIESVDIVTILLSVLIGVLCVIVSVSLFLTRHFICDKIVKSDDHEVIQVGQTQQTNTLRIELETSVAIGNVVDRRVNRRVLEVQYWLQNVVQLPHYFDVFMQNGYESLSIIKEITNQKELIEIGIVSKDHQMKILHEIEELAHNQRGFRRIGSIEGHDMIMMTQEGNIEPRQSESKKKVSTTKGNGTGMEPDGL